MVRQIPLAQVSKYTRVYAVDVRHTLVRLSSSIRDFREMRLEKLSAYMNVRTLAPVQTHSEKVA